MLVVFTFIFYILVCTVPSTDSIVWHKAIFFECLYLYLLVVDKMGRIFLDHIGGTRLFSCANCDTILTNRAELISTRFTGATGRAFLFNKVPAHQVVLSLILTGPWLKYFRIHLRMEKDHPVSGSHFQCSSVVYL